MSGFIMMENYDSLNPIRVGQRARSASAPATESGGDGLGQMLVFATVANEEQYTGT